jgi:hypothetical protein
MCSVTTAAYSFTEQQAHEYLRTDVRATPIAASRSR